MDSLCADLRLRNAAERAASLGQETTWRLSVDGFGVAVGSAATLEACSRLSFLKLPGRVSLDDPDAVLRLVVIGGKEDAEAAAAEAAATAAAKEGQEKDTALLPPSLELSFARRRFILGLEVGTRLRHPKAGESYRKQKLHARDRSRVLSELALPKRPYIGKRSCFFFHVFFHFFLRGETKKKLTPPPRPRNRYTKNQARPPWTPRSQPSCATSPWSGKAPSFWTPASGRGRSWWPRPRRAPT